MVRVLVVDDERSMRMTLSEFLREGGYEVESAEDAGAALQLLEKKDFDVVVSDIILPRVNGVELLGQIREVAPDVQVIMMTGEPTADTASKAVRAGAFDYIFKPISKETILKTVAGAAAVKALGDERDRLKEQNRVYQDQLEQLVEERTRELRESEKRYRRITESVTDYIYTVRVEDGKAVETTHGEACFAVTGYTCEGFAADPDLWLRVVAEEDRDLVLEQASRILAGKDIERLVHRIIRRDGEERWVVNSIVPQHDREGRLLSYDGLIRDITEHKRAEEERERLATAIEHAAEGIVVTDTEGTIQYVNPAFEEMTGFRREEALGKNPHFLSSGKHDEAFYRQLWETIAGGGVWSGHFTNMKKDGSLYEEEATISPVYDSSGRIVNYVAVKRDVTEQNLMDRRLRQAQKLEAIGTLAGGIAHDFNNVLAAIIGYSQIAQDTLSPDSEAHADLEHVLNAANRAKDLVRQILTFSRRDEEERQPVRIHLIIGEAIKLLRPSLPSTIEMRRSIDKECGAVLADPTQMHQIIMNLCTNAYHAMKDTGGVLNVGLIAVDADARLVALHPGLQEGTYAKLTIGDTGHGMDRETMDRIFDPFFTTKGVGEGTGLGLANVHGIVTACGGVVAVYSEPGKGTRFSVYLPCIESEACQRVLPSEPPRGGNESILVVDDEVNVLHVVEMGLERFGYRLTALTSSTEALELFRNQPQRFDLVISDVTMPGMAGQELARELLLLRPGLPIILMSGFSEALSPEKAKALGIRAFISKPDGIQDIARHVREVLDSAEAEGGTQPETPRCSGSDNEETQQ